MVCATCTLVPVLLEIDSQAEREVLVILDDEYSSAGVAHAACRLKFRRRPLADAGNCTSTRAPPDGDSIMRTRPPCRCTTPRTTANPIPLPVFRALIQSARRPRRSAPRAFSQALPGPSSSTQIVAPTLAGKRRHDDASARPLRT